MKSKFKKLMAAALVLCLVLALLPAAAFADGEGDEPSLLGPGDVTFEFRNNLTQVSFEDNVATYDHGKITLVSSDNGSFTLKAEPDPGYGLKELSINGDPQEVPATAGDNLNKSYIIPFGATTVTVVAAFKPVYELKIGSTENGTILIPNTAFAGETITVNAVPEANYVLESVKAEGIGTDIVVPAAVSGNTATFTMPDDSVSVSATFTAVAVEPTYTVGYDVVGGGGEIFVSNQAYHKGDAVNVVVTAYPGYELDKLVYVNLGADGEWHGTAPVTISNKQFAMPGNSVKVLATFTKVEDPTVEKYTIGTNVTGKGTVTISPVSPVAEGTMVTVTATPFEGYKLALLNYSFDGHTWAPVDIMDSGTFWMPAHNITVNAVFVPVSGEYAINVKTDGGCKVSQPVSAAYGEYVTIDIDMNAGHHLYNVYLDNELVTDDVYWYNGQWHYSFYMPRHDVDIYVTTTTKYFVNPIYNIDGGTVEVWVKDAGGWDSTIFADKGDWVCFKVTPYSGYELGSVSVTGRWSNYSYDVHYNNYDGCYYFKMPGESVDLSVSFVDGQHRVYVKDVSNGSLTANVNWAAEGDKVYVTAKPSKGYELTWLSVKAADGTVLKIYEALGENTYYFYMPDQYVTVSGIFSVISSGLPFVDVNSGAWYYDAVSFVYNKGIMNGVTSTTFEPNSTITRGMVVTMLWRMAGEPYVSGGSFSDVASGRYYSTAVAWAAKNGIVDGYSSTVFGVNDPVTREQFATILYRYAKYMGYSTTGSSLTGYYDANSVSSWARDAMGWAVKNGIITGSGNSRLNPTGTASRAEVAQMFMSFYEFTT
jgi:hypothetical protein